MESQRAEYILQKGEGLTIEFKRAASALPYNLFETECVFLNRNGGAILLGIKDEGEVCGVDENKIEQICKNLTNLSNNSSKLDPVFLLQQSIVSIGSKKIIPIFVLSSSQVHKTNGNCYDRGMDGDVFEVRIPLRITKETTQETTKETTKELSDREWLIISLITSNKQISAVELARSTALSADGVRYYLKKLKNKGILHRKGPTKGGEWIVLKKKLK